MGRNPRLRGVISFPKCGRTWIRLFLRYYQEATVVDPIRVKFRERHFEAQKRVMLIRNPCDVMVSHFFHRTVRRKLHITISDFLQHEEFGLPAFNRAYKEWSDYPGQMTVKYEQLFGLSIWREMLEYWRVKIDKKAIKKAKRKTKFENVRKNLHKIIEKPYGWRYTAVEYGVRTLTPKNPEAHKLRRGVVGGYVDYLDQEDINFIKENFWLPEPHRKEYIGFISRNPSKK